MQLQYRWRCPYCPLTFERNLDKYKHQRDEHHVTVGQHPKYFLVCQFCGFSKETTKCAMHVHEKYCKMNPNRSVWNAKPMTAETRNKISIALHKAALEGRNRGWAATTAGPKHKSYPEEFFTKIIENEIDDHDYKYNMPFYTWKLDFAWPKKKLCIEIDGSQHERLDKQRESDIRKDAKLIECGWCVLRIKWKHLFHHTQHYIDMARDFVMHGIITECNEPVEVDVPAKEPNILSEDMWNTRKMQILTSGVDLTKYGWVTRVSKITGLSRRQIYRVVNHFSELQDATFRRM